MEKFIELISENIRNFLINKGYIWLGEHFSIILVGLLCTGLFSTIYKILKYLYSLEQKRKLAKDLHPFYDKPVIDKAVEFFVPTKCQNVDPCRENEPRESYAFTTREKLIPFFMKKAFNANNEQRYYLVLGDSGMGKTTFMINLFVRYQNRLFGKKYNIRLFPLGDDRVDEFIDRIEDSQKVKTILLLDGLDDDPKAWNDQGKRLRDLMQKCRLFREVIITCRTQFFPSESQEPYETGVRKFDTEGGGQHIFRKIYLSPFDDKDIKIYLNKKFGRLNILNHQKKALAQMIVVKSPNLMVRPMLLSYIDDLILPIDDQRTPIKYDYPHEIYEVLIGKWILRESRRVPVEMQREFIENMYLFSKEIALKIHKNMKDASGLFIEASDILPLAKSFEINLDELELKGRSLLNRNTEGKFKFAHKSIFEYIIALQSYQNRSVTKTPDENLAIISPIDFEDLDQAKSFFADMFISFKQRPAMFSDFIYKASPEALTDGDIKHVSNVLTRKYMGYVPECRNSNTLILKKIK
jgi:hypothetical protein